MRRGIRIFIVAIVALGTNFGLHAAFGWCRPNHWRGHHDHYRHHNGCDNHGNYNGNEGCANPWNCAPVNASTNDVRDTILPK